VLEGGGRIVQETRLYDPDRDETRSMRTKEDAHDYRYFPDPDLPPLAVSEQWIGEIRSQMPELPEARRDRYRTELGLSAYDAITLTQSRELADYFERARLAGSGAGVAAKTVANWVMGELSAKLNEADLDSSRSPVGPAQLGGLLARVHDGTISGKIAKEVFDAMWAGEGDADAIIERKGLRQISDAGALEAIVAEVLAANPKQVEDYRAGKEKAFNSLVGQVMKATKGKANPAQVNALLRKKLAG
jgi:aspartyl-tRNA(Asn)/glutamyl-tRNA(Gln) amidotransferase subunit B